MTQIELFIRELEQEAITTRKMLSIVPDDQYDWKPHPKSMNIRSLATHIAELPTWVSLAFTSDGLDFATTPYAPVLLHNTAELLAYFEQCLADGRTQLTEANAPFLDKTWILRHGETILSESSKRDVVRMSFSQIIHHRAQLGVFLRLLNVPIPGSYGPSADELGK